MSKKGCRILMWSRIIWLKSILTITVLMRVCNIKMLLKSQDSNKIMPILMSKGIRIIMNKSKSIKIIIMAQRITIVNGKIMSNSISILKRAKSIPQKRAITIKMLQKVATMLLLTVRRCCSSGRRKLSRDTGMSSSKYA